MSFTYKEQYAVVVICKDEQEQESIYNRLKEEGFKLKVVAV
jgi:predicted 3-demethylubiquinone-9 3-methyltransferase (glyoxalase superfamily)